MALPKDAAALEARLLRAIEALRLIENSLTSVVDRIDGRDFTIAAMREPQAVRTVQGLRAVAKLAAALAGQTVDEVSS